MNVIFRCKKEFPFKVNNSSASAAGSARFPGKYRVEEELGAGGMGVVYRAYDTHLQRWVALKLLKPDPNMQQDVRQLLNEARSACALNHPNICTIYEAGEIEGQSYIAMELADGEPLSKLVSHKGLASELFLKYAIQVSAGLGHAHAKAILHCDLKPSNVVITREGQAKILDFGLAKRFSESSVPTIRQSSQTSGSLVIYGTPQYVAPELLEGRSQSKRSDVWNLGVMLYEMASGEVPFKGNTGYALAASILRDPPPPLSDGVAGSIQSIIFRCLKKEAAQRYQSAGEVCAALEALQLPVKPRFSLALKSTLAALSVVVLLLTGYNVINLAHVFQPASVAVLPLIPEDSEVPDYLGDGITEGVIDDLSRFPSGKVMAFSSVRHFRGRDIDVRKVARELGVRRVLVGRLKMQSGSLAVSVELVDGEDSSRVWGKTYTNNISDTMRLPDEISRDVAKQLNIQAGGDSESQRSKRYTDNQIAYDYYLRGRFHWNRRPSGLAQGITFFQQAIQADPGYALAYSGLADSYSIMASFGYDALPPGQAMPQARAAAMKSVELDPSLAEARVSLAYVDMMEYKWKAAEMGYQKAIQISPGYALAHHWYAHVLWATGRTRESLLELTKAKELDPLSPVIRTALGRQFYFTRQYDLAIEEYRTALDLDPAYIQARLALALLYQEKGLPEQANKELQITDDLLNGQKTHSLHWAPGGDFPVLIGLFGRSYALLGKRNEALTQLTRLQQLSTTRYVPPFYFAAIYIALGDNNQAFTWLQKSYADKYEALIYLQVEPGFDGLRSDPRFSQLLQQMDLQP